MRVEERTSELAAANRQLLSQIEERERVNRACGSRSGWKRWASSPQGVAHDFNNLLTVVLGNVSFLERGLARPGSTARWRSG
jgi:hypothetical protein